MCPVHSAQKRRPSCAGKAEGTQGTKQIQSVFHVRCFRRLICASLTKSEEGDTCLCGLKPVGHLWQCYAGMPPKSKSFKQKQQPDFLHLSSSFHIVPPAGSSLLLGKTSNATLPLSLRTSSMLSSAQINVKLVLCRRIACCQRRD